MKKLAISLILFSFVCIQLTTNSQAQESGTLTAITLDKLGILYTPGTGARPLAMGGAYTAISDDAFALLYNPAGLAQVRRKELSLGFHYSKNETNYHFLGITTENSNTSSSIGHFSFIYPYPTYRGALVVGFGIFRATSSDVESFKNGYLSDIRATVENRYIQSGNLYQYRIGVGVDISPNISVGGCLAIWDESIDFTDLVRYDDPGSLAVWEDNVSMDLDGISLDFAMLFRASENIKAGFVVSSPTWLSLSGDGITYYDGEYAGGGGWTTDPDYGVIDENYTLPMKLRGGVAFVVPFITLSADLTYCDYTQTKKNGRTIISEFSTSGRHTLKDVLTYHIGLEINPPSFPLRVRGGYAYMPSAVATTDEITIIEEDFPTTYVDEINVVKERQIFSAGIGTIIDRTLAIDATVQFGSFEFKTTNTNQKKTTTEVLITASYRF